MTKEKAPLHDRMARPFTQTLLTRLQVMDNFGLSDVYYWNIQPNEDPNDTFIYTYFMNDYQYNL